MLDVIFDTVLDSLKLLPFLFLTYLLMEFIEHKTSEKAESFVRRAGAFGPVIGGVLGVVPQCGFSASAASLYSGRIISLGTLVAIFLSTSDEMLPVCISHQVSAAVIGKILAVKVLSGIVFGFVIDLILRALNKEKKPVEIHGLCEQEHCHCEEESILKSAFHHTVKIALFILVISFALNTVIYFIGEDALSKIFVDIPVLGCAAAALIGLIPNCAASVVITELFLSGVISTGAMLSGLLTGSGIGLLVLFRLNKNRREDFAVAGLVFFLGVLVGSVFELTGISFI